MANAGEIQGKLASLRFNLMQLSEGLASREMSTIEGEMQSFSRVMQGIDAEEKQLLLTALQSANDHLAQARHRMTQAATLAGLYSAKLG